MDKKKNNTVEKEGFFKKQNFITALIIGFSALFIYYSFNNFLVVSGNDDYCISKLIQNGELGISVFGYFFARFIYFIQPYFGTLNAYFVVLGVVSTVSLTVINYIFLARIKTKARVMMAAAFDIMFFAFIPLEINYSYTSIAACGAGVALIIFGSLSEKRKLYKIIQIIFGFLLLLTGVQARYSPVLPVYALVLVLACGTIVLSIIKLKKDSDIKTAAVTVFKKYIVTGVLLLLSAAVVFGVNTASDNLKYTSDGYKETLEYNRAIAGVIDHDFAGFKHKDFYKSIGVKSASDLVVLREWFVDSDFYTAKKLNAISGYSKENVYGGLYNKGIISYVIYPVIQGISDSFNSGLIFLFLTLAVMSIVICILLRKRIPAQKALVLRITILIIFWLFFIMVTGGFSVNNILILPMIFLSLYISVKYNNYQYIITVLILSAMIMIFFYLSAVRLEFHSALAVIFPAMVLIISALDKDNLIVKTVPEQKAKRNKKNADAYYAATFKNAFLPTALSVTLILTSVIAGGVVFANRTYITQDTSNRELSKYIDSHPKNTFAINQTCLFRRYFDPLVLSKEKKNVANYGLWVSKSKYMKNTLKRNGINNIFRDSINDKKIRLVLFRAVEDGKESIGYAPELKDYYNNHYAKSGEKIDIVKEAKVGDYVICKVVSCKF